MKYAQILMGKHGPVVKVEEDDGRVNVTSLAEWNKKLTKPITLPAGTKIKQYVSQ